MLGKIKRVLGNQQGMETIEVIGIGVFALVIVALLYNATKGGFQDTSSKIGKGLNAIDSISIDNANPTTAPGDLLVESGKTTKP